MPLKKAKIIKKVSMNWDERIKFKGTNVDKELLKHLLTQGFKIGVGFTSYIDYKTQKLLYVQEIDDGLVEDFEVVDHNRYEYYLNWFFETFCKALTEEKLFQQRLEKYYNHPTWQTYAKYTNQPINYSAKDIEATLKMYKNLANAAKKTNKI